MAKHIVYLGGRRALSVDHIVGYKIELARGKQGESDFTLSTTVRDSDHVLLSGMTEGEAKGALAGLIREVEYSADVVAENVLAEARKIIKDTGAPQLSGV